VEKWESEGGIRVVLVGRVVDYEWEAGIGTQREAVLVKLSRWDGVVDLRGCWRSSECHLRSSQGLKAVVEEPFVHFLAALVVVLLMSVL